MVTALSGAGDLVVELGRVVVAPIRLTGSTGREDRSRRQRCRRGAAHRRPRRPGGSRRRRWRHSTACGCGRRCSATAYSAWSAPARWDQGAVPITDQPRVVVLLVRLQHRQRLIYLDGAVDLADGERPHFFRKSNDSLWGHASGSCGFMVATPCVFPSQRHFLSIFS